jgi:hypothetical protein
MQLTTMYLYIYIILSYTNTNTIQYYSFILLFLLLLQCYYLKKRVQYSTVQYACIACIAIVFYQEVSRCSFV